MVLEEHWLNRVTAPQHLPDSLWSLILDFLAPVDLRALGCADRRFASLVAERRAQGIYLLHPLHFYLFHGLFQQDLSL